MLNMAVKRDSIAARIRSKRLKAKMSQRAAAEKMGVTAVYLCYLEHGHHEPTLPLLRRIAKVLDTTVAELVK